MSLLKSLGISEIGDSLRGLSSSTKMNYNNFNISCGNPTADHLLSGNRKLPSDNNEERKDQEEIENNLGYVRILNAYLPEEVMVPSLEPYRTQEIDYGKEFDLEKNKRYITYEDKKKAYCGEEEHIFCGRFPHLSDCGCKYPCALLLPKIHPVEIIDGIYVGSIESALKTKELLFLKIKNILNLSCTSYNKRIKYFKYLDIFINDNHTENAIKYFKITNRFIEDSIESGGKILVHSENGTSRCWVFVMAYLIGKRKMNFNIAYDLVKSKFGHVEPNDNFLTQLKHYDLKINI